MKFTVASVVAFAAAVLAKPVLLNSNYDIVEGEPFTLKWSNAQGPVTITLMTGPAKALTKVTDLTTGETGEEFTFTLDDLPSGTYAIRITDESEEPNYSVQFEYEGTAVATTSSSVTTSSSTTVSSTESSSTESSESTTTTSEESTTTTSSTSTTKTASPTDDDEDTEETTPPLLNNGQRFASPLALVLGAVAALMFFN